MRIRLLLSLPQLYCQTQLFFAGEANEPDGSGLAEDCIPKPEPR